MTRTWLNLVAITVFFAFGMVAGTASAHHGGGFGGGGKGLGGGIRPAVNPGPLSSNKGPIKVGNSGNGGKFPSKPVGNGPIVGPIKPTGPFKPPVVGPIGPVGPIKPPHGPIGPIKPPKGPIVGPIGPIGPVKPPMGGGGGPPSGPICPPNGGGKHCHPHWPPIVLGCVPCVGVGGYFGGYYPPVYGQTVVVPAATTTVVTEQPVVVFEEPAPTTQVAAAVAAEKLPQVPVGSTITLNAKDLGTTGQALLVIDKVTLGIHVDEWASDHATATLPQLSISSATPAEIVLVNESGYAASTVKVELVPAPQAETNTLGTMASLR